MPPSPRQVRRPLANYYTPAHLAARVAEVALAPLFPEHSPVTVRVLDPACGDGNLLAAAAHYLAAQAQARWGGVPADYLPLIYLNLTGVDLDPEAVARARARLPGSAIHSGDALRWGWGAETWDAVILNPPFFSPLRSGQRLVESPYLKSLHPELGGTADTAAHFAWLALRLSGPQGTGAAVLPRALLSAPAVRAWRERITPRATTLWTPENAQFFEGASVFVGVVGWGAPRGPSPVRFSTSDDPSDPRWFTAPLGVENWWGAVQQLPSPQLKGEATLGDLFELQASLDMDQSYGIRPRVEDREEGEGWKLLTTGLIDPGCARWGAKNCLFFGTRYRHPRLPRDIPADPKLHKRLERARRPKVMVAGLTPRLEALLDPRGEFLGVVTTWSITHPEDSLEELTRLQGYLSSPEVTQALRVELGASAFGTSINVSRAWLLKLPIPWGRRPSEPEGVLGMFG